MFVTGVTGQNNRGRSSLAATARSSIFGSSFARGGRRGGASTSDQASAPVTVTASTAMSRFGAHPSTMAEQRRRRYLFSVDEENGRQDEEEEGVNDGDNGDYGVSSGMRRVDNPVRTPLSFDAGGGDEAGGQQRRKRASLVNSANFNSNNNAAAKKRPARRGTRASRISGARSNSSGSDGWGGGSGGNSSNRRPVSAPAHGGAIDSDSNKASLTRSFSEFSALSLGASRRGGVPLVASNNWGVRDRRRVNDGDGGDVTAASPAVGRILRSQVWCTQNKQRRLFGWIVG